MEIYAHETSNNSSNQSDFNKRLLFLITSSSFWVLFIQKKKMSFGEWLLKADEICDDVQTIKWGGAFHRFLDRLKSSKECNVSKKKCEKWTY